MPFSIEVGFSPGDIVLDGDQLPLWKGKIREGVVHVDPQ